MCTCIYNIYNYMYTKIYIYIVTPDDIGIGANRGLHGFGVFEVHY